MISFFLLKKSFFIRDKVTLQGSMELKNYQPPEADRLVVLEVKTTWLTDVYTCSFFDGYVHQKF